MVEISGATRLYAIIGDPIAQAKSPGVYNALLAGSGAVLVPFQLRAADFSAGMRGLMAIGNLDGLVFTYPHKQAALAFAEVIHPRARQVEAANAMRRRADGRWEADMFDGEGLVQALAGAGQGVRGRRIWLIGAGGAGSAIAFALAGAGADVLHVTDLDVARAIRLAKAVSAVFPATEPTINTPAPKDVDILINATPIGLAPGDGLPLAIGEGLPTGVTVVDIVPHTGTPLLRAARAAGCRTLAGASMVQGQARLVLDFLAGRGGSGA